MPGFPYIRALSFHRTYRCRHAGACCTAGWPIPVEGDRVAAIETAIAAGDLIGAEPIAVAAAGDEPAILRVVDGRCVFFDEANGRTCRIHTALGHASLPLACRQFPRVVVADPRGVSVVLSHFCPTAAAMLDDAGRVDVVNEAPAFPPDGEYVGLDARESLPPLLRPGVLMDWDAWWVFEEHAVAFVGNSPGSPGATLARLSEVVETVRGWTPGDGPLMDRVVGAFAEAPRVMPTADRTDRRLNRFLAAHAFGSWIAHLGGGLRTWLRSLEHALALASTAGVRQADLRLRHLQDPWTLAEHWSAVEGGEAATRTRRARPSGRATRSSAR